MYLSRPEKRGMPSITVTIVEDDEVVRESLAVLIGGASGFCCLGAYGHPREAIQAILKDLPDVILMDVQLPDMSGIDCLRHLKAAAPAVQAIMLTVYEDEKVIFDALQAGATGYLLKRTPHVHILAAIEEVHHGGSPMSSSIARKVIQLARQARFAPASAPLGLAHLSPREVQILEHLSRGYRYKEIAQALGINVETVRTHLRRVYEKLQVTSRTEAVVKFLAE
jgi:DNA-binding NarL/FixJ family response regulator